MQHLRSAVLAVVTLGSIVPTASSWVGPLPVAHYDSLGDPLPPGAVARFGTRRLRLAGPSANLLFTPDGKTIVTASWLTFMNEDKPDLAVRVWDASTGAPLINFGKQTHGVGSISLTRDGKLLATGGLYDGSIDIWDFPARKRLRRLREAKEKSGRPKLVFSDDGSTLVVVYPEIQVWDVKTWTMRKQYPMPFAEEGIRELALSPDGKVIAVSKYYGKEVAVIEVATGKRLYAVPAGKDAGITFSPDGACFVAVGKEGHLRIHDTKTGRVVRQWRAWRYDGPNARRKPLAYSPDGKELVTAAYEGEITIWRASDGKALRRFPSLYSPSSLTYSPDGKILGCCGVAKAMLFNVATGKPQPALPGHVGLVCSLGAFSGGDLFATAGADNRVLIWDRRRPRPLASHPFPDSSELGCRGRLFACTDRMGSVSVHDREAGKPLAVFRVGAYLFSTSISPDGGILACGDNKGTLHLFGLRGKKEPRRLSAPAGPGGYLHLNSVAFSPDGSRVAAACSDGLVRICDVERSRWVQSLDGGRRGTSRGFIAPYHSAAYCPSGTTLAAIGVGKLVFWDAAVGVLIRRIDLDEDRNMTYLAFSPDGRWLAASEGDHTVGLWEVRSGQLVGRFRGHEDTVSGVCFLNHGRQILSASHDNTLLLWDRAKLARLGSTKELEGAWEGLVGKADKAHSWAWRMISSPEAVGYITKRLSPAKPKKGVTPESVRVWAQSLGGKEATSREEAANELMVNLDYAEQVVLEAARKPSTPEVMKVIKPLIEQVHKRWQTPERLRVSRALGALEQLGTKEAKKALETLVAGAPGHWLTEEARAALGRTK